MAVTVDLSSALTYSGVETKKPTCSVTPCSHSDILSLSQVVSTQQAPKKEEKKPSCEQNNQQQGALTISNRFVFFRLNVTVDAVKKIV